MNILGVLLTLASGTVLFILFYDLWINPDEFVRKYWQVQGDKHRWNFPIRPTMWTRGGLGLQAGLWALRITLALAYLFLLWGLVGFVSGRLPFT